MVPKYYITYMPLASKHHKDKYTLSAPQHIYPPDS